MVGTALAYSISHSAQAKASVHYGGTSPASGDYINTTLRRILIRQTGGGFGAMSCRS